MKKLIILLCTICICFSIRPVDKVRYTLVTKDSIGIEIEYKEKYGFFHVDTGTVLLEDNRSYVLIKRDLSKITLIKSNLNSIKWKQIK